MKIVFNEINNPNKIVNLHFYKIAKEEIMSGHSKWANIKHRKGRQDAIRGKMFTRLAKEVTIAAREGGGDPDMNARLRLAVQNARAQNMPNDNILRAIKKGTGEIAGATIEEYTYEGYAPGGIAVIVETATDNKNRTFPEIKALFSKYGGNIGETNSVAWSFDRKGVISLPTNGKSEDEMMELVLECGADDLEYDTDTTRIICAMDQYGAVNKYFNDNKIQLESSQLEYLPQNMVKITDLEAAKKFMRFNDMFEEHEDVQNIFTNADIDDSIADMLD
jgi:YebC/PmpR family DNA-binding regulatory protein